ncbi:MAG: ATP phosphoribosyltransferase regulatory subunit, partial [Nitrospiraceae bacterium]
ERGRALAGRDRELRQTLQRLSELYSLLESSGLKDHLLLDLGEFRGFDYYDGVVFDVFAEGLGCEIGGGGRYNHLIGRFGRDLPSTGFAFDVDRLFRAMERVEDGPLAPRADILLSASPRDLGKVFELARMLRESGLRVIQGTLSGSGENAVRSAVNEGCRLSVNAVAIVGHGSLPSDELLLLIDSSGRLFNERPFAPERRRVKVKDLTTLSQILSRCKER